MVWYTLLYFPLPYPSKCSLCTKSFLPLWQGTSTTQCFVNKFQPDFSCSQQMVGHLTALFLLENPSRSSDLTHRKRLKEWFGLSSRFLSLYRCWSYVLRKFLRRWETINFAIYFQPSSYCLLKSKALIKSVTFNFLNFSLGWSKTDFFFLFWAFFSLAFDCL